MQENPYHLFFYMIAQLRPFDNGDTVRYYYAKTTCALAEAALENLPPRFIRELVMRSDCTYIESKVERIERIDPLDEMWIFQYIRNLYKHIWSQYKQIKGKYTYISRSKAHVRRITNESEVLEGLKKLGISIYWMEDLSFIDQIKLFAESELITGPHGAAYSFASFSSPNTTLYEIYKADRDKGHYPILAHHCNLKYIRYFGVEHYNETNQDMTIDVESYLNSLEAATLFLTN
jgi:capsular polysaccharide biosynthesis protein